MRSIHGASYTRLRNTDLLEIPQEFATDFASDKKRSPMRTVRTHT